MKMNFVNERSTSLLLVQRLPARLNNEQSAEMLGFQSHDMPVLVRAGLLKPLGGGPRNCVKFFAAFEIEKLCIDRRWLDRATRVISRSRRILTSETVGAETCPQISLKRRNEQ
jgi:hypothetical protein